MRNRILSSALCILFFSALEQSGAFFYRITLSRSLGAEGLGQYQIALSFLFLVFSCCSGIPFSVGTKVSAHLATGDQSAVGETVSSGILLTLGISLMASLLFFACLPILRQTDARETCDLLLLLLPSAFAMSLSTVFRGYLWGKQAFFTRGAIEVLDQAERIVLAAFLLRGLTPSAACKTACIVFSAACWGTAALSFFCFLRLGGRFAKPRRIKKILRSSMTFSVLNVATDLFRSLIAALFPALLVRYAKFTRPEAVAQYGILCGMTEPVLSLPLLISGAFGSVLIPQISAAKQTGNRDELRRCVKKALAISFWTGALGCACFLAFGTQFGILLYDNLQAGIYLRYACWLTLPLSLGALTTDLLGTLQPDMKTLKNYLLGMLLLPVVFVIAIPHFGPYALILASLVCVCTVTFLNYRVLICDTQPQFEALSSLGNLLLLALFSAMVGSLCSDALSHFGLPLGFFCGLSLTVFVFLGGSVLLDLFDLRRSFAAYLRRRQNRRPEKSTGTANL